MAGRRGRMVVLAAAGAAAITAGLGLFSAGPAQACNTADCLRTDAQGSVARQAWANEQSYMAQQQAEMEQQNANIPPAPPRPAPYSALAYHPDAEDYWIAAMYPDAQSAMFAARETCNAVMGGGCKTVWQGKGFIGAARTATGEVYWMIDTSKDKIKQKLSALCKPFELGCIDVSIYHSNSEFRPNRNRTGHNIRMPKDPYRVRKLYAAVAWLAGDGYNGKGWIASGYATPKQAQDVALNACKLRSGEKLPCEVAITTGNGVIVVFKTSQGERYLAEQSEDRARRSVAQFCKREKLTCSVHHVYDVRERGAFENVMS